MPTIASLSSLPAFSQSRGNGDSSCYAESIFPYKYLDEGMPPKYAMGNVAL